MTIKQVYEIYEIRHQDQVQARRKLRMSLDKNRDSGNLKQAYSSDQLRELLSFFNLMTVEKNGVKYLVKKIKEVNK